MSHFCYRQGLALILASVSLFSCTMPPPVTDSRELIWQRYGGQSIDTLLLDWGAPVRETRLTDNSRLVTYTHATTYDASSPYERTASCDVSFLAKSPRFVIDNVAMEGDARECRLLSEGTIGQVAVPYIPPPPDIYMSYPYPYSYRYPR